MPYLIQLLEKIKKQTKRFSRSKRPSEWKDSATNEDNSSITLRSSVSEDAKSLPATKRRCEPFDCLTEDEKLHFVVLGAKLDAEHSLEDAEHSLEEMCDASDWTQIPLTNLESDPIILCSREMAKDSKKKLTLKASGGMKERIFSGTEKVGNIDESHDNKRENWNLKRGEAKKRFELVNSAIAVCPCTVSMLGGLR